MDGSLTHPSSRPPHQVLSGLTLAANAISLQSCTASFCSFNPPAAPPAGCKPQEQGGQEGKEDGDNGAEAPSPPPSAAVAALALGPRWKECLEKRREIISVAFGGEGGHGGGAGAAGAGGGGGGKQAVAILHDPQVRAWAD